MSTILLILCIVGLIVNVCYALHYSGKPHPDAFGMCITAILAAIIFAAFALIILFFKGAS